MKQIVEMQFGSHVYGTNTPDSDRDYVAVALPDARDVLLQRAFKVKKVSTGDNHSKNTSADLDHETFSLQYFIELLSTGRTNALEMIFTPPKFYTRSPHPVWLELVENRHRLITRQVGSFAGYCQTQAAKYSLKGSNLAAYESAVAFFSALPEHERVGDAPLEKLFGQHFDSETFNGKAEPLVQILEIPHKVHGGVEKYLQVGPKTKVPFTAKNQLAREIFQQQFDKYGERAKQAKDQQGVDWKAMMHAVRVCQEALELSLTGQITLPRPESEQLLRIRRQEIPFAQVSEIIVEGLEKLKVAQAASKLPEKADTEWSESFIAAHHAALIKVEK